MTLRFESISLKNFGPYRDIDDLSLTTEPESPVVVIHGENTLGKTSIFRALRWCLYGAPEAGKTPAESARGLADYMNRPARADGETNMQVGIRFSANGQQYHLTRTATVDGGSTPRVTTDLRIGANVVQQASIDAEIGRLLHPQISEFFLFDGELLRDFYDRLNSDRERDLLRGSIESVLGIPALQLASRDIGGMRDDVMQRQVKAMKSQKEAENARRRLRELKSQQESLEKDRSDTMASLRKAELDLEDVRERIATVDDLKADAREMEGLEAQIKGGEAQEKALREEMRGLLVRGWLAPARSRLVSALLDVQTKNDAAQAKQKEIQGARDQVELLQKQIKGGTCPRCNQELPPADAATQRALAEAEVELQRLRDAAGDGPDLALERRIQALIDTKTIDIYRDKQDQLNKVVSTQYDRRRRLSTIKDRLKDNDAAAIRQLGNEQDRLEQAIESYQTFFYKLAEDETKISTEQNKLAGLLRKLGGGHPALAAEAYFFEYVSSLATQTIDRYQERTRAEVESTATNMFMKLIRNPEGYERITIGRDYKVDLVGKRGPSMKTSEGGRQLIALSLIGALKRAAVRGGPVVLDSPLARLDLEHRENVLNSWVPELGSQAILLVQSGELTEDQARKIMGKRIGQAYRIYRPNHDPEEATIERTQ
ncbi:AAA family ATPase [Arthrobacter crystallopoietes]|uniref:Nuclease SbcCD subunit C n=1 Tax=Crystallibacter crystallopoietes TaxID=37928 RepID=A0A1H0XLB1_9MICC|nr:AAA family ATPase [Arthrobacter crystallopoietes]SDQ03730.1 DNA sulfur modification protein DndD [Arthrobacter crystallopoietes]